MFPDLDYLRLKKSFEYFVEQYACAELTQRGFDSVRLFERNKSTDPTSAHLAVIVSLADFVEGTQDFCREQVFEIDRDLQKRNAYTLSFLRGYFARGTEGSN